MLQFSDALDLELASALSEFAPTLLWEPERRMGPPRRSTPEHERVQPGATLRLRTFPLMRGFARFPLSVLAQVEKDLLFRLDRQAAGAALPVLLCTTPFFAPVAEHWPGPVMYWLSDMVALYAGMRFRQVLDLDRRMCRAATLVCPNSERIGNYLQQDAGCPVDKCLLLPNATGARSLLAQPLLAPTDLPAPFPKPQRPLAGVIGNLAENMDWVLLSQLMERTPWLSWLFVGPTHWPVRNLAQRRARADVLRHPRSLVAGAQPYTELFRYARALDVAVLPYTFREPTFSGSSTRFYDHLAACHPILATAAVHELQSKEPLLTLFHSAEEAAGKLTTLRDAGFQDGFRETRWQASLANTWAARARAMRDGLHVRLRTVKQEQPHSAGKNDSVTIVR